MSLRMKNNKREGRLSSTTRKITTMMMTTVAVMMMREGLNMRHAQLEYDYVVDNNDDDERRIGY